MKSTPFRWFYEGRNGWWEYDPRTGQDLETSYTKKEVTSEMLIAGFLYIIDFQNMLQVSLFAMQRGMPSYEL